MCNQNVLETSEINANERKNSKHFDILHSLHSVGYGGRENLSPMKLNSQCIEKHCSSDIFVYNTVIDNLDSIDSVGRLDSESTNPKLNMQCIENLSRENLSPTKINMQCINPSQVTSYSSHDSGNRGAFIQHPLIPDLTLTHVLTQHLICVHLFLFIKYYSINYKRK